MAFRIINQKQLDTINVMNHHKYDGEYIVLHEYNGYSTIIQYALKYDTFKIIDVPTEKLDPKLNMLA